MKNRFTLFFLLFSAPIFAQNGLTITGQVGNAYCNQCNGSIYTSVTGGVPPYTYLWSGGSFPATINTANPTNLCPGEYFLTVTDANGMTSQAQFFVGEIPPNTIYIYSLNQLPCNSPDSSNLNPLCEKVCPNTTVTYAAETNTSATFILWKITGAQSYVTGSNNTVTVTWGAPGSGSVSISPDSPTGGGVCSFSNTICVTIVEQPVAKISATPAAVAGNITICKGQTVYFQNQSEHADSHEWSFSDDLSVSSQANPSHIYPNAGTFDVQLIARSACLCADTTKWTVTVLDVSTPTLDCVGTVCPGAKVTYTATGGCAPYSWNISGGTVLGGGVASSDTVAVEWSDVAFGTVSLNAQPCTGAACPVPALLRVPIISDNAEIVGREQVCPSSEEFYSIEAYGGTNFLWTLPTGGQIIEGQGTNRVLIRWTAAPNSSVIHSLYVQYNNCYLGCTGSDLIQVKILAPFVISGPVEACDKSTLATAFNARLTTTNTAVSCNWTLYAPNGSVIWTKSNSSSANLPAFINGVGFYRLFAVPSGPGLSCSDQADWAIHVVDLPNKPLGIKGEKKICPNSTNTYEALGIASNENVKWTVKNGIGATQTFNGNPVNITWGATGPYWISATAVSINGLNCNSDSTLLNISALGIPDIAGNPTLCEDEKGYYSTTPLKNLNIQWSISPATAGAIADGQGTEGIHIFWSQPGGHVVNIDVCGQNNQFPVTVLAKPDPMVLHPTTLCPGATGLVQTSAPYNNYSWKNESGALVSAISTPNLGPGTYSIEVTDGIGCKGTSEFSIGESPLPNLTISTLDPTGFCNNSRFVLMKALTTSDGDYTYQWFRDGNPIAGATNKTYNTNQYGDYTCQVVNQFGCSASAGPINVFPYCGGGVCHNPSHGPKCLPGDVDFTILPTARCDSFQFNLVPGPLYQAGSAVWHFGESGANYLGTTTANNPRFVFPDAGQYIVVLYATLTNGATCTVLDSVKVNAVADFDIDPACPGNATQFKDVSSFLAGSGGISTWAWNFADPTSGALNTTGISNPTHNYANTGNYGVNLTITAASGCTSSRTINAPIPVVPNASFPLPAAKCSGNALEFTISNSAGLTKIGWDFGEAATGAANDAASSPAYHNYVNPGPYNVVATVTNVYGCTASSSKTVNVVSNPLSGTITPPNPNAICEGSTLNLSAPLAATYKWSDDAASTTKILAVSKEGTYKVTLTDPNGCTFVPPPVKVEITPAPDALIKGLVKNDLGQIVGYTYPSQSICQGEDATLQAFGSGFLSYNWSGGNGFNSTVEFTEDRSNLLTAGTYTFDVLVTDPNTGCASITDPFTLVVNPTPAAFTISANNYCAGTPSSISLNGAPQANTQYVWNTSQTGTSITTTQAGHYYLRAINQFSCENKSAAITVRPGPQVSAIPGGCHTRCEPDTLCLPVIPNIVNWQWYFGGAPISGANSANFVATQSGTYHAVLTDIFGCKAESDPLSLSLYTGFGTLAGKVWSDVNHNGIIDGPDTLMSNIGVILSQNSVFQSMGLSDANGNFAFPNILSTDYSVAVDPASIPADWKIVIGQRNVSLSGCDDLEQTGFLLDFDCLGGVVNNISLSACPGGSVTYNGFSINTGATQSFAFPMANGCDSTVNVSVLPLSVSTGVLTLKACPGGSATYAGVSVPTGTSQVFALQNYHGCDSLLTVSVQPYPTSTGTLTLRACPFASATYSGISIPTGSSQVFALQNYLGCDSLLTVSVQPYPTSTGTLALQGCPGGSVTYAGVSIQTGTSQNVVLQNFHGCDSVMIVSVQPYPTSTGTLTLKACPGGSATYSGVSIPTGTSQDFDLQNFHGCDSILTVTVQPFPTSTGTLTLKACPGGSATYSGVSIPTGTSKDFDLQNFHGCDSILTVTVQPYAASTSAVTLRTCPGESVDYHGTLIAAGSVQNVTLSNFHGCDSVVTVNVLSNPTYSKSLNPGVCPGKTYTYHGTSLQAGQTQVFPLTTWLGCDSIVTVSVKSFAAPLEVKEVKVCPGEKFEYNGQQLSIGTVKDFVFKTTEGCDSIITIKVSSYPDLSFQTQAKASCGNANTGTIEATGLSGGTPPLMFSLNSQSAQANPLFASLAAGDYTVHIEDANGCQWQKEAKIEEIPRLSVALSDALLPCDSSGIRLEPRILGGQTDDKYKWHNGDSTQISLVHNAGPVWVEVRNSCETARAEAKVEWSELAKDFSIVYVPNVFAPGAKDYANTIFKAYFASGLTVMNYHLAVFDRWGNMLYETKDINSGWEGASRSKIMEPGVVVWYIEADIAVCGRVIHVLRKGDVTVYR